MKHITRHFTPLFFLILAIAAFTISASGQGLKLPRVSPPAELKQTIGLTDIIVNYSRPQVIANDQDRTGKIWGGPAWYGFVDNGQTKRPWRAGANENTTITFTDAVKIQGKKLEAGTYGLHMALYEDGKATVIFSNNSTSWGSYSYNEAEDALRVDTQMKDGPFTNALAYHFTDIGPDYGVLALSWEKKTIPFKIEVDTKETVMANIRKQLKDEKGQTWQALNAAAQYCAQNNTNLEEAMQWAEKSIELNKNVQNLFTKAQLLHVTGKKEKAFKVTDAAAEMADVNQLNQLGYQLLLQMKEPAKAVEYFKLNVERNPENANCYDSLGEGYAHLGEKEKAVKNFKKSLSMNPPDNVRQNSLKYLKELGAEMER